MKFTILPQSRIIMINRKLYQSYRVFRVDENHQVPVALFVGRADKKRLSNEGSTDDEIAKLMAGDYVSFLNDKYIDKEINADWGKPNKEERIKYYKEQIRILEEENYVWNKHGNGVEIGR